MRLEGWWGLTDAGDAFLLPATAMALDAPVATEVDAIFDVTLPAGEDPTNSSMLYASRWDTGEIVMVVYDVGSQTVVDTDVAAIFDGLPDCEIKGGLLLLYCDDNTVWFAGDGSDAMQIDATAVTAPIVEIGIIEQGIFGPSFVLDAEGGLYYLDTGTIAFLPVDTSMADGGIVGVDTSGTVFWDAGGNLYILDSTNSLFMINDQIGTELHTVVVFMVHNTPAILGAVDMDGNVIAVAVDTSSGESELIPYGQIIIPEPVAPVDSPVVFDVGGVPAYCEIASWSNTQIVCTTASHVAGLVTVDVKNGRYNSAHMSAEYIDSEGSLVSASNVGSGFLYQDVYIELVVSDAEINLALSPAVSHSYESTTLTVETNADNGYKLSYYVDGATAALICSEDAGRTIGPGSGSLADNTWGYAIGASPTTWSMPSTSNTQIDSYSSATEGRDTIFNAAGRITPLTPACDSYKAELVFTAEANL